MFPILPRGCGPKQLHRAFMPAAGPANRHTHTGSDGHRHSEDERRKSGNPDQTFQLSLLRSQKQRPLQLFTSSAGSPNQDRL